jgi:phosphate transport system protein
MLDPAHPKLQKKMEGVRAQVLQMGHLSEEILAKSLRAVWRRDAELAGEVRADDLPIDRLDVEIDQAVLELLALQAPVAHDLRQVIAMKTAATDLERVGDLARNIAKSAIRLAERPEVVIPSDLQLLAEASQRVLRRALAALADEDADLAREVLAADDAIDDQQDVVIRDTIATLRREPDDAEQHIDLIFIAKNLERVADHATNIAEDVILARESLNLKHAGKLAHGPGGNPAALGQPT